MSPKAVRGAIILDLFDGPFGHGRKVSRNMWRRRLTGSGVIFYPSGSMGSKSRMQLRRSRGKLQLTGA